MSFNPMQCERFFTACHRIKSKGSFGVSKPRRERGRHAPPFKPAEALQITHNVESGRVGAGRERTDGAI
jgi:hypothetical protein